MTLKGAFSAQDSLIITPDLGFDKGKHPSSLHRVGNDPGCRLETDICGGLVLQADQRGPWEMQEGCLHSVLQVLF